jgi:hypothetical protein
VNKTVSFTGARLTRIELVNPHSWLYFEMTDAAGAMWSDERRAALTPPHSTAASTAGCTPHHHIFPGASP